MDETAQQNSGSHKNAARSKPKKRDRSASEERLLKAAEEIFSKHGFKGATTRMIAQKAKVNESLIGRYFDGKMGLLVSLIESHMEEFPLKELTYPAQPTVREELTMFIDVLFSKHCDKDEEFFKIVMSQALTDPKFLKRIRELIPKENHPGLVQRMEDLQAKGKIKKDIDIQMVLGNLDTFFHGTMLFDRICMGLTDQEVEQSLRFAIDMYCRAIEA